MSRESESPSPSDETDRAVLREAGLRVTPQRLAVLGAMRRAGGHHLSADDVWTRARRDTGALDRSTAYRILDDLTEAGIVAQVHLHDGVTRYEIQAVPHHHAVCTVCGATEDVAVEAVEALARRLHRDTGFSLGSQALLLPGLCRGCAGKLSSARAAARAGREPAPPR